jgi:plastocyanin
MGSAALGLLVGAVVLVVLVLGGAGMLVVGRRKRPSAPASRGGGVSGPQPNSSLRRTAPLPGHHVVIHDFAFDPGQMRVAAGTTVTWTNMDEAAHTVTFRNGMADSGLVQKGQTYQYTFRSPGNFEYFCTVHPRMVGAVLVSAV